MSDNSINASNSVETAIIEPVEGSPDHIILTAFGYELVDGHYQLNNGFEASINPTHSTERAIE